MTMGMFPAGLVKLKSRTLGQPDGGNAFVIESCGEFIQTMDAVATGGDQGIDRNVKDLRCLAQKEGSKIAKHILAEMDRGLRPNVWPILCSCEQLAICLGAKKR